MADNLPNPNPNPNSPTPEPTFADSIDAALAAAEKQNVDPAPNLNPTPNSPPNPDPATTEPKATSAPKVTAPKLPSVTKKTAVTPSSDEPDDTVPANLDAPAKAKWKELRLEAKTAKEQAEAAETRAKELSEKLSKFNPEEVETLRKQNKEYEAEFAVSRVEATREFRDAVVAPENDIFEAAKTLAKHYELDESKVLAAIKETDQRRQSDLMANLATTFNARDQARFFRMGDDYLAVQSRRSLLLTNAKETLARIETKRAEQLKALETQEVDESKNALEGVINHLSTQSDFFDANVEGVDETHKKAITAALTTARETNFQTLPAQARAFAVFAGSHFPYLMQVIGGLQAQVESQEKELSGFRGTLPGAGGGGDPAPQGGGGFVPTDPNTSFLDGVEKSLEGKV